MASHRLVHVGLVVVFLAVFSALCGADLPTNESLVQNVIPQSLHRIVAIGDVHGDPDKFKSVLQWTHVAQKREVTAPDDDKLDFIVAPVDGVVPDTNTIVQLGDLVDRGYDDRRALNIAFDLYEQSQNADKASGHAVRQDVVLLLGNHELLNLQKHYRYVNKKNFGGFLNKILRDAAFDAEGPYGKFIVDNFKTLHLAERTAFVHAGIVADSLSEFISEEEFNDRVRNDLRARNYRSPFLNSRGPVWTREPVFNAQSGSCVDLEKTLRILDVDRMVVGHTPERSGHIGEYCDGKLFTVDVGLSRWMYDGLAALEILIKENTALVEDGPRKQVTISELTPNGRRQLWPKKEGLNLDDFEDL